MSNSIHDPNHALPTGRVAPALDSANESLAEALRRSFSVLKLLMLALLAAYVLSGWTRVREGQVGFVVRFGKVVSSASETVLNPGWHWAYPYPIDQVITVPTQAERNLTTHFIFQMSEEDKIRGARYQVFGRLAPARDDYILTGDLNILHTQLLWRYRIVDPVAYVTHIPGAEFARSKEYPEEHLLESIARDAAITAAASTSVNSIYGSGQQDFLNKVAEQTRNRLDELAKAGQSIGIEVVAVIATQTGGLEGIQAPRQVIMEFDRVLAAEQMKTKAIADARGAWSEALNKAAGTSYTELTKAIDEEFESLLALKDARKRGVDATAVNDLEAALANHRKTTDDLLLQASGEVQKVINEARTQRDAIVSDAEADYQQLVQMQDEYDRNGEFLIHRLQSEFIQLVLANDQIDKLAVPNNALQYWLKVERNLDEDRYLTDEEKKKRDEEVRQKSGEGFIDRSPMKTSPQRVQ